MKDDLNIPHYADLARIKLEEGEAEELKKSIASILQYVEHIQEANTEGPSSPFFEGSNALREDDTPHETGLFTEKLLELAPEREGDYVKVKKIM